MGLERIDNRGPISARGTRRRGWVAVKVDGGRLHLELTREPEGAQTGAHFGPLPGNFRGVFGPLARCLYRGMHPSCKWWDFPVGLLNPWPAPCQSWQLPPEADHLRAGLGSFVETGCPDYLSRLTGSLALAGPQAYWAEQIERLEKFSAAQLRRPREGTHRQVPTGL